MFASLAGVILASQFGAGQPAEGVGWELFSIAAVVVGGTLLTGGVGSVATTLAGVMLLGLIFNVLNFENGLGWISLSAYWQSVVRGVFLMVVVMAGSGAALRRAMRGDGVERDALGWSGQWLRLAQNRVSHEEGWRPASNDRCNYFALQSR